MFFFYRIRGLTTHEILGHLEDQDVAADVVLLPPDDDGLTDEDSDGDEEMQLMDPNHLGKGLLLQNAELVLHNDNEEDNNWIAVDGAYVEEEEELPQPGTSASASGPPATAKRSRTVPATEPAAEAVQLPRMKNKDRRWSATQGRIFGMNIPDMEEPDFKMPPESCQIPYDFYKLFVSDEFIGRMAESSQQYAAAKNKPEVVDKLTADNLRVSHAIMHLSGYLTPSDRRMYWELRQDTMNMLVRSAMSRDDFVSIISNTHFVGQVKKLYCQKWP